MKQEKYDAKMDDITSEKLLAEAKEQSVPTWTASELLLAKTDTEYDAEPKTAPTVANVGEVARQKTQKKKAEDDDEEDEKVDTTERDNRILTAIAMVVAISFFSSEEGITAETFSTIIAVGVFVAMMRGIGSS